MKTAQITTGMNGYPKGLHNVVLPDTITELNQISAEHNGETVLLRKKDGWNFWENRGTFFEPNLLDMRQNDFDTVLKYRGDCEQDAYDLIRKHIFGEYTPAFWLNEQYENGTYITDKARDIEGMIYQLRDWQTAIENVVYHIKDFTKSYDIWLTNDGTAVNFVIDEESTSWYDDTWTYQIGFIPEVKEHKFIIRDRQTGTEIEECDTHKEAQEIIADYEAEDKADGNYTPDFYEIYEQPATVWHE